MEKIYATTLNPESYDYRVYDISDDDGNTVIIDGGRDYPSIDSTGYLTKIKKLINEYSDYELEVYHNNSIMDLLDYYLPKKENGKHLSPKEAHVIKQALETERDTDIICDCLSIITGKIYLMRGLRGCCQGDYIEAYYPVEDGIQKYLNWIEAWYFGTGTEVMVHDSDFEPESAEDVEGWTFYTDSWEIEDIKAEIKSQCGYKDTDEVEVVLWLYKSTYTVKHDVYELAE